jgi:hypothetical protein
VRRGKGLKEIKVPEYKARRGIKGVKEGLAFLVFKVGKDFKGLRAGKATKVNRAQILGSLMGLPLRQVLLIQA